MVCRHWFGWSFSSAPWGSFVLILLALAWPGAEYLAVRIPETEASYENERQLERWRLAALGAGVFVPLLGMLGVGMFPLLWLASGAGFFLAAGVLTWMHWRQTIGVSIVVTRRWVTLTGVHPAYVQAVHRQEAATSRR